MLRIPPFVGIFVIFGALFVTAESALFNTKVNHIHIMKRQISVPVSSTEQQATASIQSRNLTGPPVENVSIMRNIPNILSLARLAAIPLFIYAFLTHSKAYVTSLFVIASLTDFLDGYIARKYKLTSEFGAFIDPVADKVSCAAACSVICRYFDTCCVY